MRHKLIRIMTYVYMPFLFALSGYSLMYLISAPCIRMLNSAVSLLIGQEAPKYNYELRNIYKDQTWQEEDVAQSNISKHPFSGAGTAGAEYTVNIKDVQYPEFGAHYAMLSCERIQLEVPVYWGDTTKILNDGAGQFMGSFLPGFNRCILLSAHNTTFFKPLEQIQVGDIVIYDTNYGKYQYIVDELSIMNADTGEDILEEMLGLQEEKLIMYTCYPFNPFVGSKDKRLFVFADKLLGPRVSR